MVDSVDDVIAGLAAHEYLADEGLATSIYLAMTLRRPLLLEGEAGVGKTEVAKVLSRWTGGELVRLQCYEGIDVGQAVYEWDYSRQLLHLRALEASGDAARRGAHLEPHAGRARRVEASMPLSLGRAPELRARGRDRAAQGTRGD